MGFFKICDRDDPLHRLIRDTFDANPLYVPDSRMSPLCLLLGVPRSVRYLGLLSTLADGQPMPQIQTSLLASVERTGSGAVAGGLLARIISPFVSTAAQVTPIQVEAAIAATSKQIGSCRLRILHPVRTFVDPLEISACWKRTPPLRLGDWPMLADASARLYVVDSVLQCEGIELDFGNAGSNSAQLTAEALGVAGVRTDYSSRRQSALVIRASVSLPFAFSAMEVSIDRQRGVPNGLIFADGIQMRGFDGQPPAYALESHEYLADDGELMTIT